MTAAPPSSAAELVVQVLLAEGLDTLYCVPGVQNDHLFDALYAVRDRLRLVHTRHEQGAAYMALGAAMATGRPQAFCVVPGPGMLNTTAALSTAYACNAPVLCLTGQIPSGMIGKGLGALHEIPDQLGVLQRLTKWAARIDGPDQAAGLTHEAFRQMRTGRQRPVSLECAIDVWAKRGETAAAANAAPEAPALDLAAIAAAASLLAKAERPMIVVGSGAQGAATEVQALAERIGAPVMAHRMGHGVLDSRHPLSINVAAGRAFWAEADVVVAIGTRLQFQQTHWGLDDDIKIIRIDIDPEEPARFRAPAVAIVADAAPAVAALTAALPQGAIDPARLAHVAVIQAQGAEDIAYLQPQLSFLQVIRDVLPDDGIFVDEMTQLGYVSRLAFPVYAPRTYLSPGYQGTLGWGVAAAMGAKCAMPDRQVVAVSGDGGFMFNVQELAAAVQHRIGVIIVLVNDSAFGNVRRTQIDDFGGRVTASELQNPDFIKLVESFGAHAARVSTPEDLRQALTQAMGRDLPTVIEIPAADMPSPWKFLRFTKARP
jgi:acetolactate synthase-1/2/3 large subunit